MGEEIVQGADLISCFSIIKDPREENKRHKLIDIIVIAVCAIICNADSWAEIALFGREKEKWFGKYLELPHGIPSHDTFGRVFSLLHPEEFQQSFIEWTKSIQKQTGQQVIAIDGKTNRGSFDKGRGKEAIHMVSAWSTANSLVLGQEKVDEKSNEIKAIPKLLNLLDIKGCIVSIDAMGCQKSIAKDITEKGGDYLFSLKGNQGTLHQDAQFFFEEALNKNFEGIDYDFYETKEKGHGRIETRKYWLAYSIDWFEDKNKWENLHSVGMVKSIRTVNGKRTKEYRYYITSLEGNAEQFALAIRNHWGIENSLHWVLDVIFNEDKSRVRKDNAPHNFAMLRHLAINLIKREDSKGSIKGKRLRAGWNNKFLEKIIS
jgi:predicted transposase YbfD/YdcC